MRRLVILLAAVGMLAGAARADEITFKQDYGDGKTVVCQIYKETDDYLHYIDIKKDQDAGCSKAIVEKVVRGDKPLLDVEAFFLKKAEEAKDKVAADAARAKAEEARKAAEAAGKVDTGKLHMRPITDGVKVVPAAGAGGATELVVDPFPEEDKNPPPPAKKTDASGKKGQ